MMSTRVPLAVLATFAFGCASAGGPGGEGTIASAESRPGSQLEILAPPTYSPTALEISPDGEQIVYVAAERGPPLLWVYSLESEDRRPLAGTEHAVGPFWSPDSRSIGFFADGLVKTIDLGSGAINVLASFTTGTGGTWNADGVILFTGTASGVNSVPAVGGPIMPVLPMRPGQTGHRAPHFLPDGRHFLYLVAGVGAGLYLSTLEESEIEIRKVDPRSLDPEELGRSMARLRNIAATRRVERLLDSESEGVYTPSGHLLYVRGRTLYARGFDLDQMSLTGEEFTVTDESISWARGGFAALSVSTAGHVVYRARTNGVGARQLVWLDRVGNELERLGGPLDWLEDPELSPDGHDVLFTGYPGFEGLDVYRLHVGDGEPERLTAQPHHDFGPAWSPNGERIAFRSIRGGGLVWIAADGSGTPVPILDSSRGLRNPVISDWSDDGRYLAVRSIGTRGFDIFGVDLDEERTPFPIIQTPSSERAGQFSPNGRWIAYQSDETGRFEIYVQPFPGPGGRVGPISGEGGVQVRWRGDGLELFYLSLDGWLMSVPVQSPGLGEPIRFGTPSPLFEAGVGNVVLSTGSEHEYAVSPDGQRFLMNRIRREESPISFLPDWRPGG